MGLGCNSLGLFSVPKSGGDELHHLSLIFSIYFKWSLGFSGTQYT